MFSTSTQNPPFLPNPGQPDEDLKLGHVMNVIHTIGGYLEIDGDWQSLTRMPASCKACKEDVKLWLEEKKET